MVRTMNGRVISGEHMADARDHRNADEMTAGAQRGDSKCLLRIHHAKTTHSNNGATSPGSEVCRYVAFSHSIRSHVAPVTVK